MISPTNNGMPEMNLVVLEKMFAGVLRLSELMQFNPKKELLHERF